MSELATLLNQFAGNNAQPAADPALAVIKLARASLDALVLKLGPSVEAKVIGPLPGGLTLLSAGDETFALKLELPLPPGTAVTVRVQPTPQGTPTVTVSVPAPPVAQQPLPLSTPTAPLMQVPLSQPAPTGPTVQAPLPPATQPPSPQPAQPTPLPQPASLPQPTPLPQAAQLPLPQPAVPVQQPLPVAPVQTPASAIALPQLPAATPQSVAAQPVPSQPATPLPQPAPVAAQPAAPLPQPVQPQPLPTPAQPALQVPLPAAPAPATPAPTAPLPAPAPVVVATTTPVAPPAAPATPTLTPPLAAQPQQPLPTHPSPYPTHQPQPTLTPVAQQLPLPTAPAPGVATAPRPVAPPLNLADPAQAAARQDSAAPLLAKLATIATTAAPSLPRPVVEMALKLLANRIDLNRAAPDGKAIEAAVLKAGVLLDPLARQQPTDSKSALLALRSALLGFLGADATSPEPAAHRPAPPLKGEPPRAPTPQVAIPDPAPDARDTARTLLGHTDAALSRLKLLQSASQPSLDLRIDAPVPRSELRVEVPMLLGAQTGILQLLVERDGKHKRDPQRERGWRMRFAMNFSATGEVGADIALLDHSASIAIWAADPDTADALDAMLPELAPAIQRHGLELTSLRVRRGAPHPARMAPGQLLDSAR